jgi:hypothetical protein
MASSSPVPQHIAVDKSCVAGRSRSLVKIKTKSARRKTGIGDGEPKHFPTFLTKDQYNAESTCSRRSVHRRWLHTAYTSHRDANGCVLTP